jgi:hypothetical protein
MGPKCATARLAMQCIPHQPTSKPWKEFVFNHYLNRITSITTNFLDLQSLQMSSTFNHLLELKSLAKI